MYDAYDEEREFFEAWNSIDLMRPVHYSLFTFGESVLRYYLVCEEDDDQAMVSVREGEVRVQRPMIITPDSGHPEFEDFFESTEEEGLAHFLMARSAKFSNLKFSNRKGEKKLLSDSVEEVVDRLNKQLDDEEEDHVAILTAPAHLAGLAILRYATDRVAQSAPDNIQELRERGFLPDGL